MPDKKAGGYWVVKYDGGRKEWITSDPAITTERKAVDYFHLRVGKYTPVYGVFYISEVKEK